MPRLRTTIGWMMPRSRMESASSASENCRRGFFGLARMNSIGTRRWLRPRSTDGASLPTSPINAARPRPSREDRPASSAMTASSGFSMSGRVPAAGAQFLLALDDFGGEPQIGFAADALDVVDQHRLAVGRRLGDAHVARDDGVVDLLAHVVAHVGDYFVRQIVAS